MVIRCDCVAVRFLRRSAFKVLPMHLPGAPRPSLPGHLRATGIRFLRLARMPVVADLSGAPAFWAGSTTAVCFRWCPGTVGGSSRELFA